MSRLSLMHTLISLRLTINIKNIQSYKYDNIIIGKLYTICIIIYKYCKTLLQLFFIVYFIFSFILNFEIHQGIQCYMYMFFYSIFYET